jgi:hypothetical protein
VILLPGLLGRSAPSRYYSSPSYQQRRGQQREAPVRDLLLGRFQNLMKPVIYRVYCESSGRKNRNKKDTLKLALIARKFKTNKRRMKKSCKNCLMW